MIGNGAGGMSPGAADAKYLKLTGGTLSGALAMGNNKITGLATPTANTDAANKAYVDSNIIPKDKIPYNQAISLATSTRLNVAFGDTSYYVFLQQTNGGNDLRLRGYMQTGVSGGIYVAVPISVYNNSGAAVSLTVTSSGSNSRLVYYLCGYNETTEPKFTNILIPKSTAIEIPRYGMMTILFVR